MKILDLPRWLWKWIVELIFNRPAFFFLMRYYDVRHFFDKRKERKAKAPQNRKAGVQTVRSSGKTKRRQ